MLSRVSMRWEDVVSLRSVARKCENGGSDSSGKQA